MKFLPLVLRNLRRNRRRTILTVLSIAVSIFVFAALISMPSLIQQILRDRANSLRLISFCKAGFFYPLPEAYVGRIQSIPHVEAVAGETIFMGTYRDPKDLVPSAALDPDHVEDIWGDWKVGRADAEEFRRVKTGALVGPTLLSRFRWKVGDRVTLRGTVFPVDVELTIVGTLGGTAPPYALMFRRDYLDEVLGRPGTVNLIWIKVDSSKWIPSVIADVDEKFANSSAETKTQSELGVSLSQMGAWRPLIDGIEGIALVVIFAIGLVAVNTAAMSIRERRQELAVMRAIGFTRPVIVSCLVSEGLLIGALGGGLGCLAAYLGLKLVPYASESLGMFAFMLVMSRKVAAESLLVAILIGLGSSILPASAATRGDVAGSLRAVI
ncbi:MAG TPA: ABC transporter permease [Candidatus Binataceae bacterium]|nr:ABC transporter permease [Candidatus Binataceae bacterium]